MRLSRGQWIEPICGAEQGDERRSGIVGPVRNVCGCRRELRELVIEFALHRAGVPHEQVAVVRERRPCGFEVAVDRVEHRIGRSVGAVRFPPAGFATETDGFAGGLELDAAQRPERALGVRRELADRLDLVVEQLDANRMLRGRAVHIDDVTAHGDLSARIGLFRAFVASVDELAQQVVSLDGVADTDR